MISTLPVLKTAAITATFLIYSSVLNAAPLPNGTTLLIEPGGNPDGEGKCTTGTCFGMVVGERIWIQMKPGIDGGFVVGKNQLSGEQETALSYSNTMPGDLSAAWLFFGAYGTFFADNALNTFSDTSNDGMTVLNDFNVGWNGSAVSMGEGSVNDYIINLDGMGGGTWSMDYTSVVPSGQFMGVKFWLILRGSIALPSPSTCQNDYPLRQVSTVGGAQSPVVNATVITTFTGHIMTDTGLTTGGKNSVKICPGTTLDFETTATTGTASCIINSAVTASIGRLAAGDKLICTNKPEGNDVDRFSIKSGF